MTIATQTTQLAPSRGFEQQAASVLGRLRSAVAAVVGAIPGAEVESASDLDRALSIGGTPAWQIQRAMAAGYPLAVAPHVPGAAPMKRFFQAAAGRGAPAEVVESARAAYEEFEELVKTHAPNRRAFDSMVSGVLGENEETVAIPIQERRAAFRANSRIWGHQMKARLGCMIVRPSSDSDYIDVVFVRGVVGLTQFRRDRPFVLSTTYVADDDGIQRHEAVLERLELGKATDGVNLLRSYCSIPLPIITNRTDQQGRHITEIVNLDVGEAAAFTGFLCDIFRKGGTRYRDEHNSETILKVQVNEPLESNVMDILVRRGTFGAGQLNVHAESRNALGQESAQSPHHDVLFADDSVAHLGLGADSLHTTAYPRYVEMLKDVMNRLGWDSNEFEAYRYRLEYPVMPSVVVMRFDLPERPRE